MIRENYIPTDMGKEIIEAEAAERDWQLNRYGDYGDNTTNSKSVEIGGGVKTIEVEEGETVIGAQGIISEPKNEYR